METIQVSTSCGSRWTIGSVARQERTKVILPFELHHLPPVGCPILPYCSPAGIP